MAIHRATLRILARRLDGIPDRLRQISSLFGHHDPHRPISDTEPATLALQQLS